MAVEKAEYAQTEVMGRISSLQYVKGSSVADVFAPRDTWVT
jgi:hypothetical protein